MHPTVFLPMGFRLAVIVLLTIVLCVYISPQPARTMTFIHSSYPRPPPPPTRNLLEGNFTPVMALPVVPITHMIRFLQDGSNINALREFSHSISESESMIGPTV